MKEKTNWKKRDYIIGITIIIVIIIMAIIVNYIIKEPEVSSKDDYSYVGKLPKLNGKLKEQLCEMTRNDILKDLKSPSSAVFLKEKEWNISIYNNIVEIKSYVDSQNTYGAMLRVDFEYRYLVLGKEHILCIYKKVKDDVVFNIAEYTNNIKVVNRNINREDVEDIVDSMAEYKENLSYDFNDKTQELNVKFKVTDFTNDRSLKHKTFNFLISMIDNCICIPTVTTNIEVYATVDDVEQKVATVTGVDYKFMIEDWSSLTNIGFSNIHTASDFEEDIGDKLWLFDRIRDIEIDI